MTEPLSALTFSTVAKHGLLALFGAITHAAVAHRSGVSKGVMDFALLTLMSSFSGVVFALIALHTFDNEYMTLAAAGAGGFLGVEGLGIVATKIRDSISNVLK